MSNEALSQEEVDALLQGFSNDSGGEAQPEASGGPRRYDLINQERIVRGRMPTMEIINERFARLLRIGVFNFMRRSPEISVNPIRVIKYGEFTRNLVVPTNLNLVQVKPLRGNALFILAPQLVFAIIDTLFGGNGRFHTRVEGRDFTPTEQRIIQRLLAVIFAEFERAWEAIHPLKLEFVRSEMHTQFANIATPSEIVVSTTFNLDLGESGGDLHICMPYAMLEPIRDTLYSTMQGEGMEPDKRWPRTLSKQIQSAEVEITARFTTIPMTLRQMLEMRVGDMVRIDMPKTVPAMVDGVPLFECKYGNSNGKYAVKVERIVAVTQRENEEHGR
jgi:flagellar motor switch protein FliM